MGEIEHKDLSDPYLHEPKGIKTATADTVYVANGSGSGVFKNVKELTRMGCWYYDDTATATIPITITPVNTYIPLTNDGNGSDSINTHKLVDVDNVWDVSTNRFDFTQFNVGDMIEGYVDVSIDNKANDNEVRVIVRLGEGSVIIDEHLATLFLKLVKVYRTLVPFQIYIKDDNVRNNPASIRMSTLLGAPTVVVEGLFIKGIKKGLV